jgi:hypothetical protein
MTGQLKATDAQIVGDGADPSMEDLVAGQPAIVIFLLTTQKREKNMWSSVGSAGTVDVKDLSKVIFAKSIVQLGPGIAPPVVTRKAASAKAVKVTGTKVTATIRYGVTQEGLGGLLQAGLVELNLRYRDGDGQVVASLIEVAIATGVETTLIKWDSTSFGVSPSPNFQVRFVTNTGALARRLLNFRDNAYYVSLSLSAVQGPIILRNPPAVSVIQFRS